METRHELESQRRDDLIESQHESWKHWPVNWSAVWVGALAAVAAVLVFGLIGAALGAYLLGPEQRVVDLKKLTIGTLAFSIFSSFLAFVIGGWIAGKIAGIYHSEPAMLHGGIAFLIAVPLFVVLLELGSGAYLGGWYSGLGGLRQGAAAPFARPDTPALSATPEERAQYAADQAEYRRKLQQWNEETPRATRNAALGGVTALLLGLIGSVIGGWMASGEPMTFTHHRTASARRSMVPS
jgi:hypothetical protein